MGISVYEEICNDIKGKITSSFYKPNEKLPTIKTLVEQYDVSLVTITRAIGLLKQQGYVTTKWGGGCFVSDSNLQKKLTGIATLVISDDAYDYVDPSIAIYWNQLFSQAILGIQKKTAELGIKNQNVLVPALLLNDKNRLAEFLSQQIISTNGVLCLWQQISHQEAVCIQQVVDCPVVFNDTCFSILDDFNKVQIDIYANALKVMRHLTDLGHTKIACIAGDSINNIPYRQRIEAYKDALKEKGIHFDESMVFCSQDSQYSVTDSCNNLFDKMDSLGITAVFCFNDYRALVLQELCQKMAIEVPQRLAIAGFDGSPQALKKGITTIQLPFDYLGREAVSLLEVIVSGEIQQPVQKIINCGLIIGKSTVV